MGPYLIDNNVISHYFSEMFSRKGMDFIAAVIDEIPNISVITQIEAVSWINQDQDKETIIQEFVQDSTIIPLTPPVVRECIRIRRTNKLKTPDAIIAATAIIHTYTLLTSDQHFENIKGLNTIDPRNL